jgi:hypothetical protein
MRVCQGLNGTIISQGNKMILPVPDRFPLLYHPGDGLWTAGEIPQPLPFPTLTWKTLQHCGK